MTSTWAKNKGFERDKKAKKEDRRLRAALGTVANNHQTRPATTPGSKVHGPRPKLKVDLK